MTRASHFRRAIRGVGLLFVAACAGRGTTSSATTATGAPAAAGDSVSLVLAATTDVHGRLRGWDYFANAADTARGLARSATIVDSIRAANPGRVMLVDAGDLLQGTPLTYVAARRAESDTGTHPVVAAMNAMRYDAAAIGNHEFNYGVPVLDRAIARASFPFLSANTYRPDGSRGYPAYTIVERAGVRVAIVGGTTPGANVWDRDHLRGRLILKDLVPEVRAAVADARRAGAHVVIAVLHSGLSEPSSYDTVATGVPSENVTARVAREVPGIDAIVFGHSHKEVADSTINGVLVVQPKNWATSVATITLRLRRDGAGWRVEGKRGALVRDIGHAEQASVLAATERGHRDAVAYATASIGNTATAWRADSARVVDTPLLDFVLEVQRRAANADIAAAAAFNLDASIDSGAITVGEIARLYPYENTLRAVRVSGRQIRAFLEHSARYFLDASRTDPEVPGYNFDVLSGVEYTLDLSRPIGSRVTRLDWKGRPLGDADSLTLALNNYRQTGGGGFAMLAGAPVVYEGTQEIRELLIEEVRRRGTLRAEDFFVRNWRLEPSASVATAYAATHGRAGGPARAVRTDVAPRDRTPMPDPKLRPPARRLRILATNDFHGQLEAREAGGVLRGGAAALATTIRRARAECPPPDCQSILLDGGDMFQGSLASNLVYGRSVTELYNHLGYTAAALGNHEFDWGTDTLRARMRQARYAILGANVRDTAGRDVKWIRNDTLVTRGRWKVGVIGVSTVETPRTTRAINTVGLRFLPPAPIVDSLARRLRARGADAVIVIAHAGAFCDRATGQTDCSGEIIDLAQRVTEKIDAIVSGHTHSLVDAVVKGIPIVQARLYGRALAIVDVPMPPRDTAAWPPDAAGRVVDVVTDSVPPDSAVAALVRRALARVGPLAARRIATIRDEMPRGPGEQYALGNLIADAQRWAAKGDVAVMNNGGIRTVLRAGPANYGSLFEIQPFGNTLYRLTVGGADLRAYLERIVGGSGQPRAHVSGVRVEYDPKKPAGSRISRVTMADGRPLDDASTYTIVLNDFLVTGGDGLGLAGRSTKSEPLGIPDLDALIDYLKQRPQPVAAPAEPRLIPTP